MEENDLHQRGIDVRRFVTFGVIKGFLRRVHRWPIHLKTVNADTLEDDHTALKRFDEVAFLGTDPRSLKPSSSAPEDTLANMLSGLHVGQSTKRKDSGVETATSLGRHRSSGAINDSAITFRSGISAGSLGTSPHDAGVWHMKSISPRNGLSMQLPSSLNTTRNVLGMTSAAGQPVLSSSYKSDRRTSGVAFLSTSHQTNESSHKALSAFSGQTGRTSRQAGSGPSGNRLQDGQPRPLRSSIRQTLPPDLEKEAALHAQIKQYLDGLHHADELQVKFKMGWAKLEGQLRRIAGIYGEDNDRSISRERREAMKVGDYGKVVIVLR